MTSINLAGKRGAVGVGGWRGFGAAGGGVYDGDESLEE